MIVNNTDILNGFFMFGGADMNDVNTNQDGPRLKSDDMIDKWIYSRLEKNVKYINE